MFGWGRFLACGIVWVVGDGIALLRRGRYIGIIMCLNILNEKYCITKQLRIFGELKNVSVENLKIES